MEVRMSGTTPEAEPAFRLFSDASDTIRAECSGCGRVLKISRVGATETDGGYLVSDGVRCPCGRFGRRITRTAPPKPSGSAPSTKTSSMSGTMKALLGVLGVAIIVLLASPDGAEVPLRPAPVYEVLATHEDGGWLSVDILSAAGTPLGAAKDCVARYESRDAVSCYAFASTARPYRSHYRGPRQATWRRLVARYVTASSDPTGSATEETPFRPAPIDSV